MMRQVIGNLRDKRAAQGQHPGLLLQRYLCEKATGEDGNPEEKRAIFQAAINAAGNSEVHKLYKLAFDRWKKSLPELTAANELQTVGRLIVGLGSENVLETGITLHHTYGMPILPGSALKGLAAHYCNQMWGESEVKFKNDGEYHRLLFGTTDDSGCIVFHDGWFVPDSEKEPLKLDVMTPHHPKWMDGPVPPTDFDSPTPVPFLSVAGRFHVAVSWCGPTSDKSRNWTEFALSLLRDALFHWGIGGKTTSGYGRLAEPPPPPPPEPYEGKAKDIVEAVLLEEKTKKGGWRAQIKGYSQSGPIQNSDQVPADAKPGDVVKLVIASVNNREAAFKWPQPSGK
ncbi:MAG: type III-B CRISPR module RAMP protein Cmr6 [Phycisphaerae bacterium]|nr:MAG: type III-B CRISPR module RAMP protein Cmr6 [Phycisphaerae bacterium]